MRVYDTHVAITCLYLISQLRLLVINWFNWCFLISVLCELVVLLV